MHLSKIPFAFRNPVDLSMFEDILQLFSLQKSINCYLVAKLIDKNLRCNSLVEKVLYSIMVIPHRRQEHYRL
jgi:hypothetical protein